MGVSKKNISARCVCCRSKTKMYNGLDVLKSKIVKLGWVVQPDGRVKCPKCSR